VAAYLDLYRKYQDDYGIDKILAGQVKPAVFARIEQAGFDERLSVVNLLLDGLMGYLKAADEEIVTATTEYSTHIHASVEQGNVFACQFHPEKSSDIGIQILKNFVEL